MSLQESSRVYMSSYEFLAEFGPVTLSLFVLLSCLEHIEAKFANQNNKIDGLLART